MIGALTAAITAVVLALVPLAPRAGDDAQGTVIQSGDTTVIVVAATKATPYELGTTTTFRLDETLDCYVAAQSKRYQVAALRCGELTSDKNDERNAPPALQAQRAAVEPGTQLTVLGSTATKVVASGYDAEGHLMVQPSLLVPVGTAIINAELQTVGIVTGFSDTGQAIIAPGNAVATVASDAAERGDKLIWEALGDSKLWLLGALVGGALLGFLWSLVSHHPYLWRTIGVAVFAVFVSVVTISSMVISGDGARFLT